MKKIISLNTEVVRYPTGKWFIEAIPYIEKAANVISDTFKEEKLYIVVRGNSGTILAGALSFLLKSKYNINVIISVCRKSYSHGNNLEGISKDLKFPIIVIDDFVSSGRTIKRIIRDLSRVTGRLKFDMLIVSNDIDDFTSNPVLYNYLSSKFNYVCLNTY